MLFRRLTLAAVVALAAIVVTGGAVRLSGSGLGCSTWPQCEPGSLTSAVSYHPLIEFGNRLVTIVVGGLTGVLAATSLLSRPRRRDLVLLSWGLVLGYVGQAVLGGLTVLFKLSPLLVMAHFGVSMLLLWDAVVLNKRAGEAPGPARPRVRGELLWLGRLVMVTGALILAVGTFVSGTGPHAGDARTPRLHALSLPAVTQLHSDVVLFLVGVVSALIVALRIVGAPSDVQRRARTLLIIMMAQAALGFAQYFLHLPSSLVGVHIAGATIFWIFAVRFTLTLWEREPLPLAAPADVSVPAARTEPLPA